MGFVYLFTLWFHIAPYRFIPLSLCSVAVIIGFASFGYLVNDHFDKAKDLIAGKKNFLLDKSISYQSGLAIVSLLFVILPWFYLPSGTVSYILIALQLFLFFIYSSPPLRLKERGVAGIVVDALYAHALPVLLAAYTFLLASGNALPLISFLLLFSWQFTCGVRNILIHQIEDKDTDLLSGTLTFVSLSSTQKIYRLLKYLLIIELIIFFSFFILLTLDDYHLIYTVPIIIMIGLKDTRHYIHGYHNELPAKPLRYFPNNIYEKWLPVLYLLLLAWANHYFIGMLVLHLAIFNFNFYRRSWQVSVGMWRRIPFSDLYDLFILPLRIVLSRIVNYPIYYGFLIFGVDLKAQQTTAIGYFKKKRRIDK